MADDAHAPLRSETGTSLERAVKRLEELERRQRDCEDAVYHVHGQVDRNTRALADIRMVQAIFDRAAAGDPDREPVTADGTSGGWRVPVRTKRHLSMLLGGLGVAAAAAFAPHAAAQHHAVHHVTAAHSRPRSSGYADGDGGTIGG